MIEIPFLFKLSFIFLISSILAYFLNLIKQPLIIAYILTGIITSSYFISSIETKEVISIFSELGVAFMLFIVGLELKLKIIKEIGKQSIIIGVFQEIFTILAGFFLSLFIGFNHLEALYIGIALSFSSTIIMIKLISDKGDLEKLYGKLALGYLIVQDLITIIFLIIFSLLPVGNKIISLDNLTYLVILILSLPILGFYSLPKIEKFIAQSREFTFLFYITFLMITSSIFKLLGLGLEVGALIAGVTLANLSISSEISMRLKYLKEFFLIIFFIYLGFNIFIPKIENYIFAAILLSLFVIVGNPLIMYFLLRLMKINKKTSFLLGLTSAQISEFSFIFVSLGNKLGHINNEIISLIALIGMITIFTSCYMVFYGENLFRIIFKRLFKTKEDFEINENLLKEENEILLIGCDRTGYSFLINLEEKKDKILIIEHNYDKFIELSKNNYKVIYADASDIELWENLKLNKFKLIISTIPDFKTNMFILKEFKKTKKEGIFICNSINYFQTIDLYQNGADYVNMYYLLSGENISQLVKRFNFYSQDYEQIKKENIEKIKKILKFINKNGV